MSAELAEAVRQLPTFSHLFQDRGYIAGYRDWRRGQPKGCKGELVSAFSGAPVPATASFRQQYHAWRQGHALALQGGRFPTQLLQSCDMLLLHPASDVSAAQGTPLHLPIRAIANLASSAETMCSPTQAAATRSPKMRRSVQPPCLDLDSWLSVLKQVSVADLNSCVSVCQSLHSAASSPFVWQDLAVSLDVRCCASNDDFCRTLSMLLDRQMRQIKLLHVDGSSLCGAVCVLRANPAPTIQSLDLSSSTQLPTGLLSDGLRQLPALGALDLGNWWWLQDEQLQQLLMAAPDLTDLNLSSCTKLTDPSASVCTLRRLRRLNLRCCKNVGPAAVAAIAGSNLSLVELDLSFCGRVTDDSVAVLADLAVWLEDLRLNMCRQVSDAGVITLAKHCAKLRHIELSWCTVGDPTVHSLSKMTNLTFVNLIRCGSVQEDAHQMLCKLPGLEVKPPSWNLGMFGF